MAKYMITRASIINRCNRDGKYHLIFTEKERPCKEAVLEEIKDNDGTLCSRYFIELSGIEEADALGEKYNTDILITRNSDFIGTIALVMYDEEVENNWE